MKDFDEILAILDRAVFGWIGHWKKAKISPKSPEPRLFSKGATRGRKRATRGRKRATKGTQRATGKKRKFRQSPRSHVYFLKGPQGAASGPQGAASGPLRGRENFVKVREKKFFSPSTVNGQRVERKRKFLLFFLDVDG